MELNNDPWGLPYKIIKKKIDNHNTIPGIANTEWVYTIVRTLFPTVEQAIEEQICEYYITENELFTIAEVTRACNSLKTRKAPATDGVLKIVGEICPDISAKIFNLCLKQGIFPKKWKKRNLVLSK